MLGVLSPDAFSHSEPSLQEAEIDWKPRRYWTAVIDSPASCNSNESTCRRGGVAPPAALPTVAL